MVKSGFNLLLKILLELLLQLAADTQSRLVLFYFVAVIPYELKVTLKLANELRNNMIIPTPILNLQNLKTKLTLRRELLNAEMYSIEDAIAPGYLDEVTEHEKLMELALAKAKDLATLAHPQYQQTKNSTKDVA